MFVGACACVCLCVRVCVCVGVCACVSCTGLICAVYAVIYSLIIKNSLF